MGQGGALAHACTALVKYFENLFLRGWQRFLALIIVNRTLSLTRKDYLCRKKDDRGG
jgi:hypothetical protein